MQYLEAIKFADISQNIFDGRTRESRTPTPYYFGAPWSAVMPTLWATIPTPMEVTEWHHRKPGQSSASTALVVAAISQVADFN